MLATHLTADGNARESQAWLKTVSVNLQCPQSPSVLEESGAPSGRDSWHPVQTELKVRLQPTHTKNICWLIQGKGRSCEALGKGEAEQARREAPGDTPPPLCPAGGTVAAISTGAAIRATLTSKLAFELCLTSSGLRACAFFIPYACIVLAWGFWKALSLSVQDITQVSPLQRAFFCHSI